MLAHILPIFGLTPGGTVQPGVHVVSMAARNLAARLPELPCFVERAYSFQDTRRKSRVAIHFSVDSAKYLG